MLREQFGLEFSELWAITNMPIARWREDLDRKGNLAEYERLLRDPFNPLAVDGVMCRGQVHVDSQGRVHDCDFNYALRLRTPGTEERFLWAYRSTSCVAARSAPGPTASAAPPAPGAATPGRSSR